MASRHLRKLQNLRSEDTVEDAPEEVEEDDSSPDQATQSNAFAFLGEKEDNMKEGDEPSTSMTSDQEEEASMLKPDPAQKLEPSQSPNQGKQSAPLSKQKGKTAGRRSTKKGKSGRNGQKSAGEEDLDKILQDLQITPAERGQARNINPGTSGRYDPLEVQPRKLRTDEELRRIFGSKFLNAERRELNEGQGNFAHASRKVRRMAARGLIKRPPLRPGHIIQPRDEWPPFNGALTMTLDKDTAETGVYKYEHGPKFQMVHALFEQAQASYDPNQLIQLIAVHPYHSEALNAASDLYRSSGQHETADEMLARSVYALETVWPASFKPGISEVCEYWPENEILYTTMFKYIQSLVRRGLYTTALENAKLLITFDRVDPVGMFMCIDYIALRTSQYKFIKEFLESEDPNRSQIAPMPNWVFSEALAEFCLSQEAGHPPDFEAGIAAVQTHPQAVCAMISKLEEKGVHPDKEFQSILGHKLFSESGNHGNAGLSHLVTIFAERQHTLYKEPRILGWLKTCCTNAIRPEKEDSLNLLHKLRLDTWPPNEENDFSDFLLSDFTDDVSALPLDELPMQWRGQPGQGAAQGEEELPVNYDIIVEGLREMTVEQREQILQLVNDPEIQEIVRRMNEGDLPGAQ